MAFTGITATEAQIDQKAGANVSADFTDTMKTQSLLQAESLLNAEVTFNFSDAFAGLDTDIKYIVTSITASRVAMDYINFDMDGAARIQFETRLDVLNDIINKGVATLRSKNKQAFMAKV